VSATAVSATGAVFQAPAIVTVESATGALVADGRGSLLLGLHAVDAAGIPAPVDTDLGLSVSLGQLGEVLWIEDGSATVSYTTGTWPGEAVLSSASGEPILGLDRVQLTVAPGYTSQLHTHGSLSEREGTMLSHTLLGEEQDLDVIWWTDHDHRYHPDGYAEFEGLDFEPAWLPMSNSVRVTGWMQDTSEMRASTFDSRVTAAYSGKRGLYIYVRSDGSSTADDPDQASWEYVVNDQTNFKSLLGEVSLEFWIQPAFEDEAAELFIVVPFSAKGVTSREGDFRKLILYHSATTYTSDEWTVFQRMDIHEGTWSRFSVQLSDLARETWPEPGADMHAEFISIVARSYGGATAGWYIDEIRAPMEKNGVELRAAQREYLDTLTSPITHHIGLELSHVTEGHGGAYWPTDDFSFMPYSAPDVFQFSEAVAQIHSEGGIVAFNHVFGVLSYLYSEAELDELIEDVIDTFVAYDMFGVDLLEVGYRERGGSLEHFTEVWDRLGWQHGFFVTGIGTSDQHHLDLGRAGNNFVTFIGAASDQGEDLIDSLRRGHAWFGDPDYFVASDNVATLTVPDHRAVMGQVVVGAEEPCAVQFDSTALQAGWSVLAIIDGQEISSWEVGAAGPFSASQVVDPLQDRVVRFEVHHPDAGPILYTNPVYFAEAGTVIPAERAPSP